MNHEWPNPDSYRSNKNLRIIKSGNDYKNEILKLIENSKHYIIIQIYTFNYDQSGKEIVDALIKKKKEGIQVFVLIDSIGSWKFPSHIYQLLRDLGVGFYYFKNTRLRRLGRRLHVKVFIADNNKSILGGANIADQYLLDTKEKTPWLDFGFVIEGNSTIDVLKLTWKYIKKKSGMPKLKELYALNPHSSKGKHLCKILTNDWHHKIKNIQHGTFNAISKAQKEICIFSSYFFPPTLMLLSLVQASKRGVKVILVLPGYSDVPISKKATEYMYEFLLKQGIFIYELKKSILHGKTMIVDKKWLSIGSFNFDHTSFFGNVEINAETIDKKIINEFHHHSNFIIENSCTRVTKLDVQHFQNNVFNILSYFFYRLVIQLSLLIIKAKTRY